MITYYEYKIDENTSILIEGVEEKRSSGLMPVSRGGGEEEPVVQRVQKGFREAMQAAKESAKVLVEEMNELQVSEAEIKFGLTATGGGSFVITAEMAANFEVTLKWKRAVSGTS